VIEGTGNEAPANQPMWEQPPSAVRRPRRIGPLPAVDQAGAGQALRPSPLRLPHLWLFGNFPSVPPNKSPACPQLDAHLSKTAKGAAASIGAVPDIKIKGGPAPRKNQRCASPRLTPNSPRVCFGAHRQSLCAEAVRRASADEPGGDLVNRLTGLRFGEVLTTQLCHTPRFCRRGRLAGRFHAPLTVALRRHTYP
jgi:hypothetical protein